MNAPNDNDVSGNMPDLFDRTLGGLHGVNDVVHTKPSTITAVEPILGRAQTFIVQTYRHSELGDTIFLQGINGKESFRIVIPPKVSIAINRQRDALATKLRRKIGKQQAQDRKEAGIVPFAKKSA